MAKNVSKISSNIRGVSFLVLAILIFSLQNIAVKWIGGDYSILEIVTFRSLIALPCTLLFYRYEGKRGLPTTQRYKLEYSAKFWKEYQLSMLSKKSSIDAKKSEKEAALQLG